MRNPRDTPLEYANTIANKANVLRGLLPDPLRPLTEGAPADPLNDALGLVREARELFARHGDSQKASLMTDAASEIEAELALRLRRSN